MAQLMPVANKSNQCVPCFAHTCAILTDNAVKCWGYGESGQLGYGVTFGNSHLLTEPTDDAIDLGAGRVAKQIVAGKNHTCALLTDNNVLCWGRGADGQLGYGNTNDIGDDEHPSSAGLVNLGEGKTAKQITAGENHTCAVLNDNTMLCWGRGNRGQLGYGNINNIGDDELPSDVGLINLGINRTAKQITAGDLHTCVLLDNGWVKCWGAASYGQLGYGNTNDIGDDETPNGVGIVYLGEGVTAKQITAGSYHTCAILNNDRATCWGYNQDGELGYGYTSNIGDDEIPYSTGVNDFGLIDTVKQITAGGLHTCATLTNDTVTCWGYNQDGELGYGNTNNIGDDETPSSVGALNLSTSRNIAQIATGGLHSCALFTDSTITCWGYGGFGELGYGTTTNIGDDEYPQSAGIVDIAQYFPISNLTVTTADNSDSGSGNGKVALSWNNPVYPTFNGIRITWQQTGETEQTYQLDNTADSAYTISGVTVNNSYVVSVIALHTEGESLAVSKIITPLDNTAPSTVINQTTTPNTSAPNSLILRWDYPNPDTNDTASVDIWHNGSKVGSVSRDETEVSADFLITASSNSGMPYTYTLITRDAAGNSAQGVTVSGVLSYPYVCDNGVAYSGGSATENNESCIACVSGYVLMNETCAIDIPPQAVSELTVSIATFVTPTPYYLNIVWRNPSDSDLESVRINWKFGNGDEQQIGFDTSPIGGIESYGVNVGDATAAECKKYSVTIYAIDSGGNVSEGVTASDFTARIAPEASYVSSFDDNPTDGASLSPNLGVQGPVGMDFDSQNRPYIVNTTRYDESMTINDLFKVWTLRGGEWTSFSYADELLSAFGSNLQLPETQPSATPEEGPTDALLSVRMGEVVIDEYNNLYAMLFLKLGDSPADTTGFRYVLLYAKDIASDDFDGSFTVHDVIPVNAAVATIETRNSSNDFSSFPPLVSYIVESAGFPYNKTLIPSYGDHTWYDFYLLPTSRDANNNLITSADALMIDDKAGYITTHSGGHSFAVTKGNFSYFVYMRHDVDPVADPYGNNSVYINRINRTIPQYPIGHKKYLFESDPSFADGHSTPTVAIDYSDIIHVQGGAHATDGFEYRKSLQAYSAWTTALSLPDSVAGSTATEDANWSVAVIVGNDRTYSELLVDNDNDMFSLFRTDDGSPIDPPYVLNFQSAATSTGFANNNGSLVVEQPISICSQNSYRVYYHRLYKDRPGTGNRNRVYASWASYCATNNLDLRRTLAYTNNDGSQWKPADRCALVENIVQ